MDLSVDELAQMLEETHVTKIGKQIDPLVTLLENDDQVTSKRQRLKSVLTFNRLSNGF